MTEGLGVNFLNSSPISANSIQKDEVHAQVEIDGQVLGRGIGSTWDEAKMQAAERALGSLRTMFGQFTQKRQGSPRFEIEISHSTDWIDSLSPSLSLNAISQTCKFCVSCLLECTDG
uniref:DRBM domain-containing protein n=1 Tax=Rhizophora mucronata TaxID=61149 RepID=A0A2P2LPS4_RHIMU